MRKDAQARRRQLIAAAADLFDEQGYGVALEAIAERAGVGRGTLYRNFTDRNAMIVAVLDERLGDLEDHVAANLDSATLFEEFVRRRGVAAALHTKAMAGIVEGGLEDVVAPFRRRIEALLAKVMDRAVALGTISPDLTATDLLIINRMVVAAATIPELDRHHAVDRALSFLLIGLRHDRGD